MNYELIILVLAVSILFVSICLFFVGILLIRAREQKTFWQNRYNDARRLYEHAHNKKIADIDMWRGRR